MDPCKRDAEIAALKADTKTLFKRIDEQLSLSRAVYELVGEVKVMNTKLQAMNDIQEQLKRDVEQLKSQPSKRLNDMVKAILTALITGVVAYALARIGLN